MAFARFDTGLIRERFATIPEAERSAAIALYQGLVLISAEMLLDGRISRPVLDAVQDEIGANRSRKARSFRGRTTANLVAFGLLFEDDTGGYRLAFWDEHHSSRQQVEEARKAAAERKRRSRGQPQLPGVTALSQRDVTPDVTAGQARDSRAHARPSPNTETETEEEDFPVNLDTSGELRYRTENPFELEGVLRDVAAAPSTQETP